MCSRRLRISAVETLNFVSRAAPEVVEDQRQKLADAEAGKAKLQAALARLEAMA